VKKLVLFSLLAITINIYAIPTIAIPNLVYTEMETTPIEHSIVKTEPGESKTARKSKTSIVTQISKQVQKDLLVFNAAVRGAIISSKQFKVINMPKNIDAWTGNTQTILDFVEEYNKRHKPKANNNQFSTADIKNNTAKAEPNTESTSADTFKENKVKNKPSALPNYILLGSIVTITEDENINPVKDTDKNTKQHNIDIAADYTLINTSDDSIMASFTAHGHSSDVKILTKGSYAQIQKSNVPLLIKSASKDLAEDVLQQLEAQLNVSKKTYGNESKVISDVKVYSN
jgi:hypothetical protein